MKALLTPADAARVLDCTAAAVRQMETKGKLKAVTRTEGGIRLFRRSDVEKLARIRAKKGAGHAK